MPIPVQANFRPSGMAPNVVGGQRGSLTSVGFYNDTRTSGVAPGSGPVYVARAVAYDATGDFDTDGKREPRLGIAAVDGTFAAADFAGFALKRNAELVRGDIASANTIDDTTETYYGPQQVLSRAVQDEWWVSYDSDTVVPARGDAVFIDNVTVGLEGQTSASVGVALPTTVVVFTGRVEQGWDGNYYALVNIPTKLA